MPVTSVNSDGTTVTVTVTNTQPGGKKLTVGAYLCWNPDDMELEAPDDDDTPDHKIYNSYGVCFWYGYEIAAKKSKDFKLQVKRVKQSGNTWFVGCAMDPFGGFFADPDREDVVVETEADARARKKAEDQARAKKKTSNKKPAKKKA